MYTVIIFAKLPILGEVKTRIAERSTDIFALNLYRHLLSACLLQAQLAAQLFTRSTGIACQVHWHYAGDMARYSVGHSDVIDSFVLKHEQMITQTRSGDLGTKMSDALSVYAGPAVLMGSDIPTLNAALLFQALTLVKNNPASIIFNPTSDGGYCLIGRHYAELLNDEILSGIAWSTESVMQQTRLKLLALQIPWKELPPLSDIDDLASAEHYLAL